jgi:hypothetical protein
VDHGGETVIGFVASQGYSLKIFEFAEEIFDQVPPFVDFFVDPKGVGPSGMLRNNDFGASFVEVFNDPVRIESLIGNQPLKVDAFYERRNTHRVATMPRQKFKAHQSAERIGNAKIWSSCRPSTCRWPGFESPFCSLTMAVDLNDCGIDHDELRVGIARDCVEYPFKNIGFHPMTKAFEDRVPIPKISRQIPPGRSGACDP